MKRKQRFANQLGVTRRKNLLQQKQVAKLLGHKSIEHISRYERGTKLPSLKTALKLAIIYKIPIRKMLDEYFEWCRKEIANQELLLRRVNDSVASGDIEDRYCWIEENLKSKGVTRRDIDDARNHSIALARLLAEKLDQI
jgi:transcriptional regulator with XRE-family HTH domain